MRPRFGAVHRHGSIAVIERFWGSMKRECLRQFAIPASAALFGRELRAYVDWYNMYRPHRSLGGATPHEVRFGKRPACTTRRVEPPQKMPLEHAGAPRTTGKVRRVNELALVVERRLGSADLPVVRLQLAA